MTNENDPSLIVATRILERAEGASLLGPSGTEMQALLTDALALETLDPELRGRLLLRRAEAGLFGLALEAATTDVLQAGPLLTQGSVDELRARLVAVRVLSRTLRHTRAAELLEGTSRELENAPAHLLLLAGAARMEIAVGLAQWAKAGEHAREVLRLAEAQGNPDERYQALMTLALVAQLDQRLEEAVTHLRHGAVLAEQHADAARRADAAMSIGNLCFTLGRLDESREAIQEALGTQAFPPAVLPLALSLLGRIALASADPKTALRFGIDAAKAAAAVGNAAGFADGTQLAAEAQLRLGDVVQAARTLQAGETVLRSRQETQLADLLHAVCQRVVAGRAGAS